ncbi:uncharacterized protein LOC141909874 [Tubulanus polymorphus]|uniref:uncharacterized protein LOC141909874 n=1 Tax=Tubulanus polymorphus TaxID=672921 RepID=UPI003DA400E2
MKICFKLVFSLYFMLGSSHASIPKDNHIYWQCDFENMIGWPLTTGCNIERMIGAKVVEAGSFDDYPIIDSSNSPSGSFLVFNYPYSSVHFSGLAMTYAPTCLVFSYNIYGLQVYNAPQMKVTAAGQNSLGPTTMLTSVGGAGDITSGMWVQRRVELPFSNIRDDFTLGFEVQWLQHQSNRGSGVVAIDDVYLKLGYCNSRRPGAGDDGFSSGEGSFMFSAAIISVCVVVITIICIVGIIYRRCHRLRGQCRRAPRGLERRNALYETGGLETVSGYLNSEYSYDDDDVADPVTNSRQSRSPSGSLPPSYDTAMEQTTAECGHSPPPRYSFIMDGHI